MEFGGQKWTWKLAACRGQRAAAAGSGCTSSSESSCNKRGEVKTIYMVFSVRERFKFSYHIASFQRSFLLENNGDNTTLPDLNIFARAESDEDDICWAMGCGTVGSKILLLGGFNTHDIFQHYNFICAELDTNNPEGCFDYAGKLASPKAFPLCAEIGGKLFVLNGFPLLQTAGFEVYNPNFPDGSKFMSLKTLPGSDSGLLYRSMFAFGTRIYASRVGRGGQTSPGIYHFDVKDVPEEYEDWMQYDRGCWVENETWGTLDTLPFSGSSAFTCHFDTEHPGNGYFFSFSGGKLFVNVIQDWIFKKTYLMHEVAKPFYSCARFGSLGAGYFVLVASPPSAYDLLRGPCEDLDLNDIYIITFHFKFTDDYGDDRELGYKFQVLSDFRINRDTFPMAKKNKKLIDLQVIGCFPM